MQPLRRLRQLLEARLELAPQRVLTGIVTQTRRRIHCRSPLEGWSSKMLIEVGMLEVGSGHELMTRYADWPCLNVALN
jgi:hypothetical protein